MLREMPWVEVLALTCSIGRSELTVPFEVGARVEVPEGGLAFGRATNPSSWREPWVQLHKDDVGRCHTRLILRLRFHDDAR